MFAAFIAQATPRDTAFRTTANSGALTGGRFATSVPATMELLGKWNWWLPRPLARVLPRTAFEAPAESPQTQAA